MTTGPIQSSQLSNNTLQPFKSNIIKVNDNLFNCNLILSNNKNFIIPMREDGYINATLLCKASGKDIRKWKENKSSKELLNTFSSMTGIPVIEENVLSNSFDDLFSFHFLISFPEALHSKVALI